MKNNAQYKNKQYLQQGRESNDRTEEWKGTPFITDSGNVTMASQLVTL